MKSETVTYTFTERDAAWSFMRACDAAYCEAGWPNWSSDSDNYTVKVLVLENDRKTVDALAGVPS